MTKKNEHLTTEHDQAREQEAAERARIRAERAQRRAQREERNKQIFEYRKAGLTYRQIAEKVGISYTQVRNVVLKAYESITRESAQQLVTLEKERLDTLLAGIWRPATEGDTNAISTALSIMRHLERLHGVDKLQTETDETQAAATAALTQLLEAAKHYATNNPSPDK